MAGPEVVRSSESQAYRGQGVFLYCQEGTFRLCASYASSVIHFADTHMKNTRTLPRASNIKQSNTTDAI